jgi:hypothetical protein
MMGMCVVGFLATLAFNAPLRRPRIEIQVGLWKIKVLDYQARIAPMAWEPVDVA